ncbi:MAG TPA: peptidylprolyl isomerase [Cyclobacteriaceae bacterium]|nr:peptidylprolyl isomerase [Cyclobacteriaceae bacterium]
MKHLSLLFWVLIIAGTTCLGQKNVHVIETEIGDIVFKTYPKKSPIAVKNFEKYEQKGDFEGASFYRVVRMDNQPNDSIRIEVIQGNFTANENSEGPIPHVTNDKTGILHKDGAVSMARGKPGTASVAFFICINDQPELDFGGKRNPDGQGFDAFGQVISGMDIVRKIQSGQTEQQTLKSPIKITRIYKKN